MGPRGAALIQAIPNHTEEARRGSQATYLYEMTDAVLNYLDERGGARAGGP